MHREENRQARGRHSYRHTLGEPRLRHGADVFTRHANERRAASLLLATKEQVNSTKAAAVVDEERV